ncbi:hypothetical protein [Alkalihalobacillus sp. 1P02AB]|uniref:hypothetical protein n=1 Tax=Alkalihalobacillus sp. 1P02AB TaxID=3132260 RepID=UPI0039A4DF58
MASKGLQSFAAGMIIAVSVCGVVYYTTDNSSVGAEGAIPEVQEQTDEELIGQLQESGYVVQTESEWKSQLEELEAAVVERVAAELEAVEEDVEETDADSEEGDNIVYRTMLTVSPGMTSIDVGRALESANIIDNARDFFNEVEKRDLSNELRPGTFEVESGMSMGQIIDIIF